MSWTIRRAIDWQLRRVDDSACHRESSENREAVLSARPFSRNALTDEAVDTAWLLRGATGLEPEGCCDSAFEILCLLLCVEGDPNRARADA